MPTTLLRAAALAAALLPTTAPAEPLSFDQALSLAVQRSEAARAARASARSATEASRAAGQLPDPMLLAGIENLPVTGPDRFSTTREAMTMKRIGISQEWVPADRRAAREAAALAIAGREAVQAGAAESQARLQAAMAYVDAWYADAALALAVRMEHHLHEELEAARSRLAAGAAGSPEVLQVASAKGMAEDEGEEARQQQAAARAALQRWVGFRPEAVAPVPALALPGEQDYVSRNGAVSTLRREAEVARQNAIVAARQRTPNWSWELAYGQRTGYSDLVSFGVSIPLQLAPAQRQDRETAAQLALVEKAEAELAEAVRAATADYRTLAGDAERLQGRIDRYRGAVVAPARQRTDAALAAFRSNQLGLAALFEARHAEVQAQRRLLALQRELAQVHVRLAFTPLVQGDAR